MRNVISNSFSLTAQKPTVSVDHIDNYYIVEATGTQPAVDDSRWQYVAPGGAIPMPTPAAPYLWHKTVTYLTDGTHLAPVVEFAGSMGQNGIDYDLVPSHSAIIKDENDNRDPANVTCALVKRNADGSADNQTSIPTGYSIKVTRDTTTTNYTLGSNVSTAGVSVIVFSLYYGAVEIERHTISVVAEGGQGVDGRGIQSQDYRFKANATGVIEAAPTSEAQWNTWKALNAAGYSESVPYLWRCCKTVYVDGHGNTETVYVVDGPTVWGKSGQDIYYLDLDNEMDAIPCDSTGKTLAQVVLTTNYRLYKGPNNITAQGTAPTAANIKLAGITPTITPSSDYVQIQWTIPANTTISADRYTVSIPVGFSGETYRSVFTANVVKSGAPGVSPAIYQLLLSCTEVSFARNASNVLTPASVNVRCGYTKTIGETITKKVGDAQADLMSIDGKYNILYRPIKSDGTAGSWAWMKDLSSNNFYLNIPNSTTHVAYEFVLTTASGAASIADSNIVDRETLPINKDGLNGAQGESAFIMDLDNEQDAFGTDSDGNIAASVSRETTVAMFYGLTPLALTGLTATKKYDDGNNCGNEVSVTTDAATGKVTVTLGNTSFSYTKTIFIDITGTCSKGSKTARFTLQPQAGGAPGVTPTIYQLVPIPSALVFTRDSNDTLQPASASITPGVKKTEGNDSSILSSLSGYKVYWGWDNAATPSSNVAVGTDITVTRANAASHSSVVLELWQMNGNTKVKRVDRETVPINKDGLRGPQGEDGDTPFIADIDNEMTSIAITQEGKVEAQIQLSFNVSAYYGSTNVIASCQSVDLVNSEGTPINAPTGFTVNTSSKSTVAITIAANTQPAELTELRFRVVHADYGTRYFTYSIAAVKSGGKGQDAVLYELLPSASEIAVGRNADGTYNPSTASLTCGYKKIVGPAINIYDDVTGAFDGYNIYFRRYNRSTGQWSNYLLYTYYKSYLSGFAIATYSKFEFIICRNTATSVAAANVTGLIDKETVPVVADGQRGKDGVNAITIDLDNEIDAFGTDPSGKISAAVTRSTNVSMFDGITPLTLTGLEVGKTYEDGTTCGNEVTVTKDTETGAVTVQLTSTSFAYTKTILIDIMATTASGSRNAVFTLQPQASGQNGVSPIIYQLQPIPSALSFARNSSGSLVIENNVITGYVKKVEGNDATILSSLSGYRIYYGYGNPATPANYISVGGTITVNASNASQYTQLVLELWKMNGSTKEKRLDRETIPINKQGEKGQKGDDGTTPFVVDIDNEMTSIPISQEGKVESQIVLSFNIGAYYGQTNVINDCTVALVGSAPSGFTVDTTTSKSNPRITIAANTTPAEITELRFRVTHSSYGERDAVFSIAAVKSGGKGQDAVLYELLPSDSQISVGRTDAGGYNPSTVNLTCGYIKKAGTAAPTTVTDATGAVDGYSIYFRRYARTGSWSSFFNYVTYKSYLQGLDVATYSKVQFILCKNTGAYFTNESSITGLIDKETVPIVADGTKGKDGANCFVLDIDNEMAAIPVDSSGKVTSQKTLTFGLAAYYGTTLKTSECEISYSTLPSGFSVNLNDKSNPIVTISANTTPAEITEITFTATHATYGTRSAIFTICSVKSGGKGEDAELYQLFPSESSLPFERNSSGNLVSKSYTLSCQIQKIVGSAVTNYNSLSGYNIYYGWDGDSAPTTNWTGFVTVNQTTASSHTSVVLELWRGTRSSGTRLDRETIPILKDGAKGPDGDSGNGIANIYFYRMFTTNFEEPQSNDSGWISSTSSSYPTEEGLSSENRFLWVKKLTSYTKSDNATIEIYLLAQFTDGVHENLLEDTAFLSEGEMEAWDVKIGDIGKNTVGMHNGFGNTPVWADHYTEMLQQVVYKYGSIQKLKANTWYTLSFYAAMQTYQDLLNSSSVYNGSDGGSYWQIAQSKRSFWLDNGQSVIVTMTGRCYSSSVKLKMFVYGDGWTGGSSSVEFTSTSNQTKSILFTNNSGAAKLFHVEGYVYLTDGNDTQNTYTDLNHRCYVSLIRIDRGGRLDTYLYRSDNSDAVVHSSSAPWYVNGKKITSAQTLSDGDTAHAVSLTNGNTGNVRTGTYVGFTGDGHVNWQLKAGTSRYTVTFKTPSTLYSSPYYRVLFRLATYSHYGWISMPKLEEGTAATDWIENTNDRKAEDIQHVYVGDWVASTDGDSSTYYFYGGGTGVRHVVRARKSYNGAYTYWRMKVRTTSAGYKSTSQPYNDTTHWEQADWLKFIATDFILAENAVINFAQTNRILVTNSSGVVAAGMGGAEGGNDDFPLWVGATYTNRANAPFRVTLAGILYANGANILGKITGSLRTPFCRTDNIPSQYNGDNFALVSSSSGSVTIVSGTFNMMMGTNPAVHSGRTLRLVAGKWGSTYGNGTADVYFKKTSDYSNIPIWENGHELSYISLSNELVELVGYGDDTTFFGWIVTKRIDFMTSAQYGAGLKCLLMGKITGTTSGVTSNYLKAFDASSISVSRTNTGLYRITVPTSWKITTSQLLVIATPVGYIYNGSNMLFCSVESIETSGGYVSAFSLQCSDDQSRNDGCINFAVFNMNDWVNLK